MESDSLQVPYQSEMDRDGNENDDDDEEVGEGSVVLDVECGE